MWQLHRFFHLAPAERHLLLETSMLLVLIRLGLSVLSFRALLQVLAAVPRVVCRRDATRIPLNRIAWAVRVAGNYIPATCLIRALTAHVLLTRRRQPSRVHIGVSKNPDDALRAHAWVESGGKVVIGGSDLQGFTPLYVGELQDA